jgi:membrane-bound lytic murein transglycosylase A
MVFVDSTVPSRSGHPAPYRKLMFDQDTGGAIRTAGRADIYLGVGDEAELRAGSTRSVGQMTYMFLAE